MWVLDFGAVLLYVFTRAIFFISLNTNDKYKRELVLAQQCDLRAISGMLLGNADWPFTLPPPQKLKLRVMLLFFCG